MDSNRFKVPVTDYMTRPVATLARTQYLSAAEQTFRQNDISALAVTDDRGHPIGVISRTDLLRAGHLEIGQTLRLPKVSVESVMSYPPLTVGADASVIDAAQLMLQGDVHRVFVIDGDDLVGVVSSRDLMRAVRDLDVMTRIDTIAAKSVITIGTRDTLGLATDRLDLSNKHGLVVVEGVWPVGVFAQPDALIARSRDPETFVEDVMDSRVIALPGDVPLRRAATQALAMGIRRLFVVGDGLEGVVSGLDFARAIQ